MIKGLGDPGGLACWYRERCISPSGRGPQRLASCFRVLGWSATNMLIVLGLPALLFLAITGFSFELTLLQIDNLTDRFAEAESHRRAAFVGECRLAAACAFAMVCLLRWPGLVRAKGGGAR
ncbi:MAG: hypothetical protein WA906_03335 [Pacificimonas sp.]